MEKRTLSVNQFCESIGIGRTKAYELLAQGEIEAVRIGRRTLITVRSVEALIERSGRVRSEEVGATFPRGR